MTSLIAPLVDHTLLKPEATVEDVAALVTEAIELGVYSVCVSPSMLPLQLPAGTDLKIAVVCGFPLGTHTTAVKVAEARESIELGADEVDMVIDLGAAKAGRYELIEADIAAVRAVIPAPRILKVIIESAMLTDEQIVATCRAAAAAGADFVKTSTGFSPAGGATLEAVRLMVEAVDGRLGVKASGGIRSADDARAMIAAGATRLGLSSTAAILAEEAGLSLVGAASDAY